MLRCTNLTVDAPPSQSRLVHAQYQSSLNIDIDVQGGMPSQGHSPSQECTGGGAGTAFYASAGEGGIPKLIIDNGNLLSGVRTTISDGPPTIPMGEIRLLNGALLRHDKGNITASTRIYIKSRSTIELNCGQQVVSKQVMVYSSSAIRSTETICIEKGPPVLRAGIGATTTSSVSSLVIDTLSELSGLGLVIAKNKANIGGRIHSETGITLQAEYLAISVLGETATPSHRVASRRRRLTAPAS